MEKIFTVSEAGDILKFKCQMKWKDLTAIPIKAVRKRSWYGRLYYKYEVNPKERYCESCQKSVYLCLNDVDVVENTIKGNCIALQTEISKKDINKFKRVDNVPIILGGGWPSNYLIFCRSDGFKEAIDTSAGDKINQILVNADSVNFVKQLILLEEKNVTCKNQNLLYVLKKCLILVEEASVKNIDWSFVINENHL